MNDIQFGFLTPTTPVSAVILDLDGTILNTEQATNNALKEYLARYGKVVDTDKENKRLGMTESAIAIAIVKDYDLPITPDQFSHDIMPMYREKWLQTKALPGANRIIKHLYKHGVPLALASNSVQKIIDTKISRQQGWKEYFSVILGSDQVKSGKPAPDIFLEAANKMGVDAVHCLVIEDSVIGVKAAKAAGMNVVLVHPAKLETDKDSIADTVLHSLLEFQPELWGLPPFEDWVDKALPIEPFDLKGLYNNGILHDFTDDELSALPDQVSGVYFGWAKLNTQEIFKVVVNIGWEHNCGTIYRKIQACLLDTSNEDRFGQKMQVSPVGYIRGLRSMENKSSDIGILEEDKLIAKASLDLPAFANRSCL